VLGLVGAGCGSSSKASANTHPGGATKSDGQTTAESVCADYIQFMYLGQTPKDQTGQWVVDGLERIRSEHASDLRSVPKLKAELDSAIAEQRANVVAKQGPIDALDRFNRSCEPFVSTATTTTR
jgi:hypothetical protein